MNRRVKLALAVLGLLALAATAAVAASTPSAATGPATSITTTSAVIHGTVHPGGAKTYYNFQWGPTTAYGSTSKARSAGSGTNAVPVQLGLHGLHPGTTYHYRIGVLSHLGIAEGPDRTFKTKGNPPAVPTTGGVSSISSNSATVQGLINPNNEQTNWYVQYGPTTAYSARTNAQTLPAGAAPVAVTATLPGLQSGAVFHYRFVAVNRGITQVGNDAQFMTYPNPARVPRISVKTRPGHDGKRPYTFTTTGTVHHPAFIASTYACSQSVRVRYFMGGRRVGQKTTPVQPNCTFSATASFKRLPKHAKSRPVHLKVVATFLGNGYLAEHSAKAGNVTEG
ncbi:MAG TPA: hypothetical protein VGI87_04545 [Solirubrobacteraceae bacterium]|jgi:cytochrome c5